MKKEKDLIWVEVSGEIERECVRNDIPNVSVKLANEYLKQVKNNILDDYHYERRIGDKIINKTIFGFKNEDTYNSFINFLNEEIQKPIKAPDKPQINEEDYLYKKNYYEYYEKISETEKNCEILTYLITLHRDDGFNELPKESYEMFKNSLKEFINRMNRGEYETVQKKRYELIIEDCFLILKRIRIIRPIKLK